MILALGLLIIGLLILRAYIMDPTRGLPAYGELQAIQGRVAWVDPYEFGVRFGFSGDSRGFAYLSKAEAHHKVTKHLVNAGDRLITVLAELDDSHSPLYSDKTYHVVFQVVVGEQLVRSYQEVADAWAGDNKLMLLVGILLLLSGGFTGWQTHAKHKPS